LRRLLRHRLRPPRLARILRNGGLIAHGSSTIPGIAAHPGNTNAIQLLQRFKQRDGPFLLLVASRKEAARWVRYWSPALRRSMRQYWPGTTTLVFPGRPGLPACCYQKGLLALRVDGTPACRHLAFHAGGLLISTSLNRRGQPIRQPSLHLRMRWHRYIRAWAGGNCSLERPSAMLLLKRNRILRLR